MSIIDIKVFAVKCLDCETTDEATMVDRGNRHEGSYWRILNNFTKFEGRFTGGGANEHELDYVRCLQCGSIRIEKPDPTYRQ